MFRNLILLLTLHFCVQTAGLCQNDTGKDSLFRVIQSRPEDSLKVQAFYQFGEIFETSRPDSALYYYEKGKTLAHQIGYFRGEAVASSYSIVVLNNQGRFKEALEQCKEALTLYKKYGNKKDQCKGYINVGSEWQYLSDFQSAAVNYLEGKKLAEELGDKYLQRVVNNNLASVFNSLSAYEKGKLYARNSLVLARELKDDYAIASSTINLAVSETNLKQLDSSIHHFREVYQIGINLNDSILQLDGWIGIGDNYKWLNKPDSALYYYMKTLEIATSKGYREYELYAHLGIIKLPFGKVNRSRIETSLQKGMQLAQMLETKLELRDFYEQAAIYHENRGDIKKALDYRKQFELLNDSVLNEKNRSNINLLEIKFETAKKEGVILKLEDEKQIQELRLREKTIINRILGISAIVLFLLIFLLHLNYRQKKLLQEQQIAELEKEKQLMAASAVLQGQEEERSRLARDLHDSMGGLLSGIKNSFTDMKENLIMSGENLQRFEKGLALLDTSINEFRRVAHNMMPEALQKFGLDAAVRDFCADMNSNGHCRITYQSFEIENLRLPPTTSISIYRVIQELLQNVLKHAEATTAMVEISKSGEKLLITVEDNGKGFDPAVLTHAEGIGWNNIRNRITFIKGVVDVVSAPQQGTSVNIEIDL